MTEPAELQAQQILSWNGEIGAYWVAQQERLDEVLAPIGKATLALAAPERGERAVDIGCGCGATALMLAEAVGATGRVTGLDISAPMLARARERSAGVPQLDWIETDAAEHPFAPQSIMFFADPKAAFANLRQGLKPGGRLAFSCWRSLVENPWMNLPFQASLDHVPSPPRPNPEDLGPFAFADRDRVTGILTAAGFAPPDFVPLDVTIDLANAAGLDAAVHQATSLGAARRLLEGQPEAVRAAAAAAIREALAPHLRGGSVVLPGAVWLVRSL